MDIAQKISFGFGSVLIFIILLIALKIRHPTAFQYTVFRIILSLACSCAAVLLTGFLTVSIKGYIQAGGALAVFIVVYLVDLVLSLYLAGGRS